MDSRLASAVILLFIFLILMAAIAIALEWGGVNALGADFSGTILDYLGLDITELRM